MSPPPNFFRPIGPQFEVKIKWGGGGGPGPSPGSATEVVAYGGWWHLEVRLYGLFFLLLYVYFVCLLGFEGEILALEAKLKELNEKEAEFTDAIKQQEGKIESVKMEFAPQQNALDKRQEEIEEREKTIQQEYVSNETPILGVYWAAVR